MIINANYDNTLPNAPSGFQACVTAAINFFETTFTNHITINITFSCASLSGCIASSSSHESLYSYATVVAALAGTAARNSSLSQELLPSNDPFSIGNGLMFVTSAEAKALGIGANYSGSDGTCTIDSSSSFNFDPNVASVAGKYCAVGALEHEISEILGRQCGSDGLLVASPLALFRYMGAGQIDLSSSYSGAYFSVDGGATNLAKMGEKGSDLADWGIDVKNDPFGYASLGGSDPISQVDMLVMEALGYTLVSTAPTVTPIVNTNKSDFNKDGKSDILWRGGGGEVAIWDMNNTQITSAGQATLNGVAYNPGTYWSIAGSSDYSGDGKTDILWRGAGGEVALWDMNNTQIVSAGQATSNGATYNPGSDWTVEGTADFNGDAKADILWRGEGGEVTIWDMNNTQIASAGQTTSGGSTYNPGTYWTVAGTGDFNGDGKADILWRGEGGEVAIWDMNNTQISSANQATLNGATYNPGSYWSVAGIGDFNSDGKSDILWRGAGGEVAIWDMNNNQIIGANQATINGSTYNPGTYWNVAGTGNFNADTNSDILWRGAGGEVAIWDMNNNQITSAGQATNGLLTYNPGTYWNIAGS